MDTVYVTRNGKLAHIDGISQYRNFGKDYILLSGDVDGEICAWDGQGRYRLNQVLGIKESHELDLVSWVEEN